MTIYQIYVEGVSTIFDSKFKMHSKKVYTNYPRKEEIEDFIKLCTDEKYFNTLDTKHDYKVVIDDLELIEN